MRSLFCVRVSWMNFEMRQGVVWSETLIFIVGSSNNFTQNTHFFSSFVLPIWHYTEHPSLFIFIYILNSDSISIEKPTQFYRTLHSKTYRYVHTRNTIVLILCQAIFIHFLFVNFLYNEFILFFCAV